MQSSRIDKIQGGVDAERQLLNELKRTVKDQGLQGMLARGSNLLNDVA